MSSYTETIAAARAELAQIKDRIAQPFDDLEVFRQELRTLSKEATEAAKGAPKKPGSGKRGRKPKEVETQPAPVAVAAE